MERASPARSITMDQAGDYIAEHVPVPVINPGPVAVKTAGAIVQLGLTHSKIDFASPSTIIEDRFFSLGADPETRGARAVGPTSPDGMTGKPGHLASRAKPAK